MIAPPIKHVRIEEGRSQGGNPRSRTWKGPAVIHFIGSFDEPDNYNDVYAKEVKFYCKVMNTSDGFKFSHESKGCKNPCVKRRQLGQDPNINGTVTFTITFNNPGIYDILIGNNPDVGYIVGVTIT